MGRWTCFKVQVSLVGASMRSVNCGAVSIVLFFLESKTLGLLFCVEFCFVGYSTNLTNI